MKTDRKFLVHYVDAAFDTTYAATDYQLLGADLESFEVSLNPQIETKKNILGETAVYHSGYEPSSNVDTFFHDAKKALEAKVMELAMAREYGDSCKTSYVECLYNVPDDDTVEPTLISAYREDIIIAIQSYGGDTTGVQVPFDIHYAGNRVKGTFDKNAKTFTAATTL